MVGDFITCDLGGIGPAELKILYIGDKTVKLRYCTSGTRIEMSRGWLDAEIALSKKYSGGVHTTTTRHW